MPCNIVLEAAKVKKIPFNNSENNYLDLNQK